MTERLCDGFMDVSPLGVSSTRTFCSRQWSFRSRKFHERNQRVNVSLLRHILARTAAVTLITKSDQIGVNRTKSEIPSTKSGPCCKVKTLSERSDLVQISNADLVRPFWACIFF